MVDEDLGLERISVRRRQRSIRGGGRLVQPPVFQHCQVDPSVTENGERGHHRGVVGGLEQHLEIARGHERLDVEAALHPGLVDRSHADPPPGDYLASRRPGLCLDRGIGVCISGNPLE
jgi:hypothetical protein